MIRRIKTIPFALIIITCLVSCSIEETALPMRASFHQKAISQLPPGQKVQTQEMIDWYATNMKQYDIKPQWDKSMQTIRDKKHVVEIMTGNDGGLFFTKVNGELTVYACRWMDKDPKNHDFVGNIAYYSFKNNKISGSVYDKNGFVRSQTMTEAIPSQAEFLNIFMSPDFWTVISLGSKH